MQNVPEANKLCRFPIHETLSFFHRNKELITCSEAFLFFLSEEEQGYTFLTLLV